MKDRILNGMFVCYVTLSSLARSDYRAQSTAAVCIAKKTNHACRMTQFTSPENVLLS